MIKIGNCGWGFFRTKDYFGADWKKKYESALQAYAELFDLVEVNSSFYKIPQLKTALKWREQVGPDFEFTVKCNQIVTHKDRFASKESVRIYKMMEEICQALRAKIMLLQCPAGFHATKENIQNLRNFLKKIKPKVLLSWEPRGDWWDDSKLIKSICEEFNIINCVDPFRNDPLYFGKSKIAYFRLHGFGKPMMYNYKFSKKELEGLLRKMRECEGKAKTFYVLFNNMYMYEVALRFRKLLQKMKMA